MWLYDGKPFSEDMIGDFVGFVYVIINEANGRSYVGKKNFTKSKTFQKNKKKKRTRVSSDWESYTGSSDALNADIEKGHKVSKIILHLCTSKGRMSYLETKEIIIRDAILKENYYNVWFSCRVRKSHLKGS